jgi:uncharacterized protein
MLLFSLHDVTPFHLSRLRRADALFARWGIQWATYLLTPRFHGGYPADASPEFGEWLRQSRPFKVEWALHGCFHRVADDRVPSPPRLAAGGRELAAADEGEFRNLAPAAASRRIASGQDAFRACLRNDPTIFVAPRWQLDQRLWPLLAELGFEWSEDKRGIRHLPSGARIAAPVITWATRTPLRKLASIVGTPVLAAWWRGRPVLRIAVHPFDFDEPATVRSIEGVVRGAIGRRRQVGFDELLTLVQRTVPATSGNAPIPASR